MKKVLLATTALAFTAGMAAAEVNMTGTAEIGVKSVYDADDDDNTMVFHDDLDIRFTLSGETDTGLSFGAIIDLDEISNGINENHSTGSGDSGNGRQAVFVSGDFGTITMGDTDGAFDWAMAEISWGSAIADDHTEHAGWAANSGLDGTYDGQVARYDYAFGDFAVGLSAEMDDEGDGDPVLGVGARYSTNFGGFGLGFGLAYQRANTDDGDEDIWGASVSADMENGFQARLNYSDGGVEDDDGPDTDFTHWGVGVGYEMDALLIEANYGRFDFDDADDADGYGLAVNYDLGGGALFEVGYGYSDPVAGESFYTWSAGLGLVF